MSSQINAKLSCFIEMMQQGIPISLKQIQPLLSQFTSEHSESLAITKLLSLIIGVNSACTEEEKKGYSPMKIVEYVLDITIPLLQVELPLKYLVYRQDPLFTIYCGKSEYKDIKELKLRSCGLYPINNQQNEGSLFSRSSKGNPHWMCSRYVLKQWFIINRNLEHQMHNQMIFSSVIQSDQLPYNVSQTYSFLLSQKGFTAGHSVFGKFWGLLYCYYTQHILEREYLQSQKEQKYLTWRRSTDQDYQLQFYIFEDTIPEPIKIIYHLITLLIPSLMLPQRSFQKIYSAFNNSPTPSTEELEIVNQTLFLKLAELKSQQNLVINIKNRVRRVLLERGKKLNAFFPIYFTFEELMPMIVTDSVAIQQFNFGEKKKKEIACRLLEGGEMSEYWLPYLTDHQFLELFSSHQWSDYSFAGNFLKLIRSSRSIFISHLSQLAHQTEMFKLQSQLQIFLNSWSSYLQQKDHLSPQYLDRALSTKTQHLRKRFQFMILPRGCPQAVFKLLMGYCRYFNDNRSQIAEGGSIKKQLTEFQEEKLPQLIGLIDQEQRTEFWMQFGNVTRSDSDFVDDLLKAAQAKEP